MENKLKKILIVRFSSIGDIVLTSPVIRTVALQTEAKLHFITKSKFKQVVEKNPHIEKVYTFEKEITEIITPLKNEKYDLIIDLHKNLRSKRLIATLRRPSIDFDKINIEKWISIHLRYNMLPDLHLVDRYFNGLKKININDDGLGLDYFHGLPDAQLQQLIPSKPYVCIILGATYYTKRIPTIQLERLLTNIAHKCILLGGNDVSELASELSQKFRNIENKAGKISLNESAALVAHAHYVVTGDTGMMHIAAAYKKPIMMWWGSTAYDLGMYPFYGNKNADRSVHLINKDISCSPCSKIGKDKCPKGHFKCMLGHSEGKVINAIEEIEHIASQTKSL